MPLTCRGARRLNLLSKSTAQPDPGQTGSAWEVGEGALRRCLLQKTRSSALWPHPCAKLLTTGGAPVANVALKWLSEPQRSPASPWPRIPPSVPRSWAENCHFLTRHSLGRSEGSAPIPGARRGDVPSALPAPGKPLKLFHLSKSRPSLMSESAFSPHHLLESSQERKCRRIWG